MPLTTAARDHITKALIGSSGLTVFNNANAYLGVGGGAGATTAFAIAQTDLQGASKTRKPMDATYPTDPPSPANRITARSTFASGDANYTWDEWGLFNASTAGTMLCRVVTAMGTKTPISAWILTVTLDLSV